MTVDIHVCTTFTQPLWWPSLTQHHTPHPSPNFTQAHTFTLCMNVHATLPDVMTPLINHTYMYIQFSGINGVWKLYLVLCSKERAMAYSATTVLPADVWAATNTQSWLWRWRMACFWNRSSSNGNWRWEKNHNVLLMHANSVYVIPQTETIHKCTVLTPYITQGTHWNGHSRYLFVEIVHWFIQVNLHHPLLNGPHIHFRDLLLRCAQQQK